MNFSKVSDIKQSCKSYFQLLDCVCQFNDQIEKALQRNGKINDDELINPITRGINNLKMALKIIKEQHPDQSSCPDHSLIFELDVKLFNELVEYYERNSEDYKNMEPWHKIFPWCRALILSLCSN